MNNTLPSWQNETLINTVPSREYVAGFLFTHDKKQVALIEKIKPDWQKGKLNGIGGKIEGEETIFEALSREFYEEAGWHTLPNFWTHFCTLEHCGNLVYFLKHIVTEQLLTPILTSTTEEKVDWYNVEDIINNKLNIIPNLKWLIPVALDKDDITAFITDPST